jgi:hypothetical protein
MLARHEIKLSGASIVAEQNSRAEQLGKDFPDGGAVVFRNMRPKGWSR